MVSKELFVTVIRLIQEQEETDRKFSDALNMVCDHSYIVYGTNNKLYSAVRMLLKESCNDVYEYIDWWLYEDVEHIVYSDDREWHLDSASDLYDFIAEMQDDWIRI